MAELNINISEELMDRLVEDAVARMRSDDRIRRLTGSGDSDHEALTSPVVSGGDESDYRYIADAVIERFNPNDSDDAEAFICTEAIHDVADFVESLRCYCLPDISAQCRRCQVLGRFENVPVDR